MLVRSLAVSSLMAALAVAQTGVRNSNRALQQPSAKFAATWSDSAVVAADCINEDDTDGSIWGDIDVDSICTGPSSATSNLVLSQGVALGKIKIPNDKEALITLSSQINIFTINTATSKKKTDSYYGNIGATSAMAGVSVLLTMTTGGTTITCAPGPVIMASRYVELRNRIGGNATYVDCIDDGTCELKVADLELESSIGIAMDTTAAHSFQWVCPDLPSATYDVGARFDLTADANDLCDDTSAGDCSTISDFAGARVVLGPRVLTVQQVRAVKGSLEI